MIFFREWTSSFPAWPRPIVEYIGYCGLFNGYVYGECQKFHEKKEAAKEKYFHVSYWKHKMFFFFCRFQEQLKEKKSGGGCTEDHFSFSCYKIQKNWGKTFDRTLFRYERERGKYIFLIRSISAFFLFPDKKSTFHASGILKAWFA